MAARLDAAVWHSRSAERWYARWADQLASGDPLYNPNLTRTGEDLSLRSDESKQAVEADDWTTGA